MKKRLKTKKIAAILITSIVIVVAVVALFINNITDRKIIDVDNEIIAYYSIDVNPSIDICVDANDNIIDIIANNDDGKLVLQDYVFEQKPLKQVIQELFDIMMEMEFIKEGKENEMTIGYYSDYYEITGEVLKSLIPKSYQLMCEIKTVVGTVADRMQLRNPTAIPTTMMLANNTLPFSTLSPTPTIDSSTEPTSTTTKGESYEGEHDDPKNDYSDLDRNKPFILKAKLSGNNVIFTWSEYDYIGYQRTLIHKVPKFKSSNEEKRTLIKTLYDENIRTYTISLSSLNFKEPGDEYFFMLSIEEDIDDPDGEFCYLCANTVSIQMRNDGSLKVYNDDPSPYGHGETGVDYFAPTMTINEEAGGLIIRWKNQTHDDYNSVILHVSTSSAVPERPEGYKANYRYISKKYSSYTVCPEDFYSLKAGETYYFTIYAHFHSGQVIVGNTIRATIPGGGELRSASINGYLDFNNNQIKFGWTDISHPEIVTYRVTFEYLDENATEGRINYIPSRNNSPNINNFLNSCALEPVPGRTYYLKISTIYSDGTIVEGNEIALKIPSATPEPSEDPTPEPSEDPTPEPSEVPTPEPSENPTPEPSDDPTPEPSEAPTPEPSDDPTPEPSEDPTPEPSEDPTPEPSEDPTPEST